MSPIFAAFSSLRFFSRLSSTASSNSLYEIKMDDELKNLLRETDKSNEQLRILHDGADPLIKRSFFQNLRSVWTYHSNAIEGNKLTLNDTIFLLSEGLTVSGKPLRDTLETVGHASAIDYLYETIKQKIPFHEGTFRALHSFIFSKLDKTTHTMEDALGKQIEIDIKPGQYKTIPNKVRLDDGTFYEYVPPNEVPSSLNDLVQWYNDPKTETAHPLVKASMLHYNFVRIHPFRDGNGRVSRLLMNYSLIKDQFFPISINVDDRNDYYAGLRAADRGDLAPFTKFLAQTALNFQAKVAVEIENGADVAPRSR